MTKAELKMLEKIFAAEIDAALSGQPIRGVYQTRGNKTIRSLKDKGMVENVRLTLGGRFPVVIEGWALSPLGHLTYCMSCDAPTSVEGEG